MTNLVPIDQAKALAPAKMRERFKTGEVINKNFADGVRDTFPTLSIKGKVFRMRQGGREQPYVDPNTNQVMTFLDVVFVNASRLIAKSYYEKGFAEGDMNPPDCWSLDSIRPDASVANKQSPTCAGCAQNAFGSRITDNHKQAKACQDQRRVAVTLPHLLAGDVPTTVLLRVPQSSLKPLKAYVDLLARHQFEPTACITRLSFDYNEAFPKLQFQFVKGLTDEEYDKIETVGESDYVQQMLNVPEDTPQKLPPNENEPLKELVPGPAPVLVDDNEPPEDFTPLPKDVGKTVAPQVQQAAANVAAANLIALPDGKFFNPLTGQYVEPPKQAEPEVDPAILVLPDGKFFNPATGTYVPTNFKGGAPVEAKAPEPEKPAPKPRAKAQPKPKAEAQPAQADLLPPVGEQAPAEELATPQKEAAKPDPKPAQKPTASASQNGTIGVAPPDLDDILKGLVPPA